MPASSSHVEVFRLNQRLIDIKTVSIHAEEELKSVKIKIMLLTSMSKRLSDYNHFELGLKIICGFNDEEKLVCHYLLLWDERGYWTDLMEAFLSQPVNCLALELHNAVKLGSQLLTSPLLSKPGLMSSVCFKSRLQVASSKRTHTHGSIKIPSGSLIYLRSPNHFSSFFSLSFGWYVTRLCLV